MTADIIKILGRGMAEAVEKCGFDPEAAVP
jgi:hypothetical protein